MSRFPINVLHCVNEKPNLLTPLLTTDAETSFHLCGYVNKQICNVLNHRNKTQYNIA